ncbi:MAG: DNA methyltransferase [Thermoplasmata archaeon]
MAVTVRLRAPVKAAFAADMNFPGSTREFTHAIHSFAARFPPRLPRHFINELSAPGDTVLDPMMGSGTTILEAALSGRVGVGFDIDPLAVLITQVKTSPCDPAEVERIGAEVLRKSADDFRGLRADRNLRTDRLADYGEEARAFFDYWFNQETVTELLAILGQIRTVKEPTVRNALLVAFSSMVITKSAGVTLARDIAHTRPHKWAGKEPASAFDLFPKTVRKLAAGLSELTVEIQRINGRWTTPKLQQGDARHLPLPDNSVDLVVTSPPYATALDYMRANKFTLSWLGYPMADLTRLRGSYIGTESRPDPSESVPRMTSLEMLLLKIAEVNKARSRVVGAYFSSMLRTFSELHRVMKPGAHAIVVIGPSGYKGIEIPTHLLLADGAAMTGFSVTGVKEREIDRNGRQMPMTFFSAKQGIEARIHTEFILGFVKPSNA